MSLYKAYDPYDIPTINVEGYSSHYRKISINDNFIIPVKLESTGRLLVILLTKPSYYSLGYDKEAEYSVRFGIEESNFMLINFFKTLNNHGSFKITPNEIAFKRYIGSEEYFVSTREIEEVKQVIPLVLNRDIIKANKVYID